MNPNTLQAHRDTIRRFIRATNKGRASKAARHAAFHAATAIAQDYRWEFPRSVVDLDTILLRSSDVS